MKRRLAIVVVTTLALCAGGAVGAPALAGETTASTGDWGCVVIRPINQGLCFENPLPSELPSVQLPVSGGTPV